MLDTNNPTVFIGALILIASAALFGVRFLQPRIAREYDVVISIVGLIYGVILVWEGWRLIPLLFFGQVLLISTCGFFAFETLRLRYQLSEKARQAGGPVGRTTVRRGSSSVRPRGGFAEAEPEARSLGSSRRQLRSAAPRQLASSNPGSTSRRRPNLDDPEPPTRRQRRPDDHEPGNEPKNRDSIGESERPRRRDDERPEGERRRRPRPEGSRRPRPDRDPNAPPRRRDEERPGGAPEDESPRAEDTPRRRPPRLPEEDGAPPVIDIDQLDDLDDDELV